MIERVLLMMRFQRLDVMTRRIAGRLFQVCCKCREVDNLDLRLEQRQSRVTQTKFEIKIIRLTFKMVVGDKEGLLFSLTTILCQSLRREDHFQRLSISTTIIGSMILPHRRPRLPECQSPTRGVLQRGVLLFWTKHVRIRGC